MLFCSELKIFQLEAFRALLQKLEALRASTTQGAHRKQLETPLTAQILYEQFS